MDSRQVGASGPAIMRKLTSDDFIMLRSLDKEELCPYFPMKGCVLWKHNKKWVYRDTNDDWTIMSRVYDSASFLVDHGLAECLTEIRWSRWCYDGHPQRIFRITENGRTFLARCNAANAFLSR